MLVPGDGAGQTVVIDAEELRRLANAARSARSDVDHALSRIAGIMGPLDRRGWSAGAADGAWLRARSGLVNLEADLEQHAAILDGRANLVDRFETRGTGSLTNQVELTAAGIPSADDRNTWEPILPLSIVPNAADPYAIEIALQREQVQQFLSPVLRIDLSNREGDPWNIALDGLKLMVSAVGDTPSDCNDAFVRLAQAVPQGPDAVRDALQKSRPGCNQSRSLIRLSGVLVDGTPIDIQVEATLNQFLEQMTAMADGLGGGELGGRRVTPAADVGGRVLRPSEEASLARLKALPDMGDRTFENSVHQGEEVFDNLGNHYDFLGTPEASLYWSQQRERFLRSIDRHLLKSNTLTVIDLTGFMTSQVDEVVAYLKTLTDADRAKIIRIGF